MIHFKLLALVALFGAISASVIHPFSDEFIDRINSLQTTWKAGRNFAKNTPIDHIKNLVSRFEDKNREGKIETVHHVKADDEVIPESFDARENWPTCDSIKTIRDVSNCDGSWAVASASVMSDRICIASNGTDQTWVSEAQLLSCCTNCGNGCDGGSSTLAWNYWIDNGIVSGGPYRSKIGCQAFSLHPCDHLNLSKRLIGCGYMSFYTPTCRTSCDSGYNATIRQSMTYGLSTYKVSSEVVQIQLEILRNGPVQATITTYSDFSVYQSGVYQNTVSDVDGSLTVRVIGWGVENEVPYWLVTNAWNKIWGDNGLIKILRGENTIGIEENVIAGLPDMV